MAESITLQTSDNNVQQSDVLGRLSFAASNESSGSDARLIGASIYASAESDFTAISNATSLVFATASSENATERMRITSGGSVGIGTSSPSSKLELVGAGSTSDTGILRINDPSSGGTTSWIKLYAEDSFGFDPPLTWHIAYGDLTFFRDLEFRTSFSSVAEVTIEPSGDFHVVGDGSVHTPRYKAFDLATSYNTAAKPAFTWVNDDDNGMFLPTSNNIAFSTAGLERLRIDSDGKVGIGTASQSEKLDVNGSIKTRTGGVGHEDNGCYIAYPGGGTLINAGNPQTGYLKITLPVSWTSTMLQFEFDLYEYSTGLLKKFRIAGYNFAGGSYWANVSAIVDSDNDYTKYKVHFGHDGTYCAIYISEINSSNVDLGASSTWIYSQGSISNFFGAWSNMTMANWADGWSIGFTTTLGTITNTRESSRPYRQHDTSYVFNEYGGNVDFRVEGDTDPNLLFVDASVDDVGIGTNTPAAKLHIAGDTLFENLSYRRFTTSTAITTHFRKYYDIAHYANSVSTVAGSLRIEIPVTTSTMWSMDVVIVEYDGVNGNNIKTTNLTITGYTTSNLNRGVWTNNPSRINQVRFGRKSGGGSTIILIDPTSTFRYPKAYIKEINTHHSNETTFSNSANYSITITSDETDFILNGTITNDQFIRDDKLVNTFGNQTVSGNKTFDGNVVINDIGGNFDFRVEGDTDTNLLFTDASTDRVGIGTSSPTQKLQVITNQLEVAGFNFAPSFGPLAPKDLQNFIIESRNDSIILKHLENPLSDGVMELKNLIRYSTDFISIDAAYSGVLGITYYPKLKVNTSTGATTFNDAYTLPTADGSSGQALVTNGSGVVGWSDIASANLTRGSFEVTSTQSTFTVSGGYTLNTLSVYYNGVKLLLGTDFTATNGTTFTLTNAAVNGDIVEYWALNSASSAVGNTSTGSVSVTSNQTVFNVTNGYTVGGLIVFVNGVKLVDGVDFTATNGSSFTLTSAATSGDVVDYIAYGAVVASSNLQKTGDTMTGNLTIGNGSDLIVEGDLIVAKYKEGFVNIGNAGSTQTINISNGTLQTCVLNSSCTFTMPTAEAGRSFTLLLKTGTGSFTSTFTNVKWPNDTAPTITTTANKMDILTFVSDGVNWYGNISQNYSV